MTEEFPPVLGLLPVVLGRNELVSAATGAALLRQVLTTLLRYRARIRRAGPSYACTSPARDVFCRWREGYPFELEPASWARLGAPLPSDVSSARVPRLTGMPRCEGGPGACTVLHVLLVHVARMPA